MSESNILAMPTARRTRKAKATSPREVSRNMARKLKRQRVAAGLVFGISTGVVALSLSHLAQGVVDYTGSDTVSAWLMASGIDLLMLAHKAGNMVAATEAMRREIAKWTNATVLATSVISAHMNSYEFVKNATDWNQTIGGVVLGCAIPALVYASLTVGYKLWTQASR